MRRFLRTTVPAALVVVSAGCGLLDRSDAGDGAASSGPSAAVDGTVGPAAGGAVVSPGEDVADAGSQLADAVAASPGNGAADPPAGQAEDADASQDTLSLEARLDLLIAGQESLARRLDSLAAAGPTVAGSGLATVEEQRGSSMAMDTADGSQGAGERLGAARQQVRNFGIAILWSAVVMAIINLVVRALVWTLDTLAERNARRRLFYKRLVPIIRIVLWVFTAYFIVHVIFQVDAQGIIAAAAAVGVAVGFAAQDLLKNLFGGVILVFDQPFQTGDKISVGGTYGEVVSIGLRSTRIVTPDDNLVSVPNAQVVDQQVANANAGELNCQVVTDLYLPGWADEAQAKEIAYHAAAGSRYVYLKKPIVVLVSDVFKTTFLTRVRVKAYVLDPRLEFLFQSDVTERARSGFREAGLLTPEQTQYELVRREVTSDDG